MVLLHATNILTNIHPYILTNIHTHKHTYKHTKKGGRARAGVPAGGDLAPDPGGRRIFPVAQISAGKRPETPTASRNRY